MRALGLLSAAILLSVLAAGCVGPETRNDCPVPGAQGSIPFQLVTTNGTRDVAKTNPARWVVLVSCSEEMRPLSELTLNVVTAEHGTLVAQHDEGFGNVLTLYAQVRPGSGTDASLEGDLPPPGPNPSYRLRLHNEGRSDRGLDEADWMELAFDGDGDRDFQDTLPAGDYRLQVRDRETGEGIGLVVHRYFARLG